MKKQTKKSKRNKKSPDRAAKQKRHEVIVSGIGSVFDGYNEASAGEQYAAYVQASRSQTGEWAVTWLVDGEIKAETANLNAGSSWPGLKDKSHIARVATRAVKDAFDAELETLHNLQSACQVALRDVPHQKGCQFWNAGKPWVYRESCTCVRKPVADLEKTLGDQLG